VSTTPEMATRDFTADELAAADAGHYSMLIRWSEEDRLYLVSLPEWRDRLLNRFVAHGATYAEAAAMGREVLALLIAGSREDGTPLPRPDVYIPED
jgi:antitoxin HicB